MSFPVVNSCLPSVTWKAEADMPAPASRVSPEIARCVMIVEPGESGSTLCQPVLPLLRSIIWSWLHLTPESPLALAYATTTLPSGVGFTGVSHTLAGSGTLHTSEPSATL
ncbi:hypothetical protein GCM10014713_03850 [Streptomyces purpureus]|uniref:Uncharacterized protein n=1 Tax=Streptomyces purpureus TaxID=1951 RepID=A0A918LLY6_9ACTN|nr:hypothetical protein GCM10014713_03850 [Streptomyces purpureus]